MSLELGLGWEGLLPSESEAGTSWACAGAGLFQLHLVERWEPGIREGHPLSWCRAGLLASHPCGLLHPAPVAWGSPFPGGSLTRDGWGLATRVTSVTSSGLPWWSPFDPSWLPQARGFP